MKMPGARHRPASPAQRLREMYTCLLAAYGPQKWWPAETPFEVVVGAYLTQNTSWRGVELSIRNLSASGVLSVDGVRGLAEEELRLLIRPSGYMRRKAAALKTFIAWLDRDYGGSMARLAAEPPAPAREKLLTLPGVGPETADAILLYALGQPTMVVDEYLRRIVVRHELLPETARYAEIQSLAVQAFEADRPETLAPHFNEFHALVVMAGKTHCGPKPRCEGCPLAKFLPSNRGLKLSIEV